MISVEMEDVLAVLQLCKPYIIGIIAALVIGIVIMVGGNIPKETRIASVAIYDQVQALNFEAANRYAFVLFILSFLILLLIYSINRKTNFTTFR